MSYRIQNTGLQGIFDNSILRHYTVTGHKLVILLRPNPFWKAGNGDSRKVQFMTGGSIPFLANDYRSFVRLVPQPCDFHENSLVISRTVFFWQNRQASRGLRGKSIVKVRQKIGMCFGTHILVGEIKK